MVQAINKRRAPRSQTQTEAKLKSTNGDWCPVNIVDLSNTGACVSGKFSMKVGFPIEILLPNEEGRHHYVIALVVWMDKEKAGINFFS